MRWIRNICPYISLDDSWIMVRCRYQSSRLFNTVSHCTFISYIPACFLSDFYLNLITSVRDPSRARKTIRRSSRTEGLSGRFNSIWSSTQGRRRVGEENSMAVVWIHPLRSRMWWTRGACSLSSFIFMRQSIHGQLITLNTFLHKQAWVPSWSFGRRFENGQSIDYQVRTFHTRMNPPHEFLHSLSLVSLFYRGEALPVHNPRFLTRFNRIYASAFCATLKVIIHSILPCCLLTTLPGLFYRGSTYTSTTSLVTIFMDRRCHRRQ